MHDDSFMERALQAIGDSEVITLFFPLLRRAIVVDTRSADSVLPLIAVMPQASSMEARITSIERLRPELGKVHSILGIPWMQSVRKLRDSDILERIVSRVQAAGVPKLHAENGLQNAVEQVERLEQEAYAKMIRGESFRTLWSSTGR